MLYYKRNDDQFFLGCFVYPDIFSRGGYTWYVYDAFFIPGYECWISQNIMDDDWGISWGWHLWHFAPWSGQRPLC